MAPNYVGSWLGTACNGAEAEELTVDFCAECLASFIQDRNNGAEEDKLPESISLGFTFSYPCIQDRIDHGVLLRWTKGFGAPGVEGKDVAALFKDSLEKFVSVVVPTPTSEFDTDNCYRVYRFSWMRWSTIRPVLLSPRPMSIPVPRVRPLTGPHVQCPLSGGYSGHHLRNGL